MDELFSLHGEHFRITYHFTVSFCEKRDVQLKESKVGPSTRRQCYWRIFVGDDNLLPKSANDKSNINIDEHFSSHIRDIWGWLIDPENIRFFVFRRVAFQFDTDGIRTKFHFCI